MTIGAYYNGLKLKYQPESGTGGFSYKIWTKNSKKPMVSQKTLGHFQITIKKEKSIFFFFEILFEKFRIEIWTFSFIICFLNQFCTSESGQTENTQIRPG